MKAWNMHTTIPIRPFVVLKLVTLALLAFVLLLLNGCHSGGVRGNGHIVTDTRQLPAFNEVEANGAYDVTWASGEPGFSVTTDENLLPHIQARSEDGKLKIEWDKWLKGTRGIKIMITSPTLARVQLNGAVRFVGSNFSGPELYLTANGASRVALQGNVNAVSAEMNGASRLDAESLVTRAMELSISGAGKAEVNVSEVLKVDISGAGKVVYTGNPKTVDKSISGAGSVKRRE
ncbi:MAG: head GIN domain-containing protein [Chthoniobacterales bacterium]